SYFTKVFKCGTGFAPNEWLMSLRVDRVKELTLGGDVPLSQIGVGCGFCVQAHFSLIFFRRAGASPSNWGLVKRQLTDAAL
ncbi:helix-turn-helix domain-containing protein, partial [Pseudomonas aeruginosa]